MTPPDYAGYRFPSDLIQRAVWMYLRFTLSYRDVEDLLAASRCLTRRSVGG
jgi:putative transposase